MAANKIYTVNFVYGVDRTESLRVNKEIHGYWLGNMFCSYS